MIRKRKIDLKMFFSDRYESQGALAMENRETIIIICFGFYFFLALLVSKYIRQGGTRQGSFNSHQDAEITDKIHVGKYLGGFSAKTAEASMVFCAVTNNHFIFTQGTQGKEVGRIPRYALSKVVVMSGPQVTQSFTDKNIRLISGIKSKAESKTSSLILEWGDERGAKHDAVFEFSDSKSQALALDAADALHKWMTIKTHRAAS